MKILTQNLCLCDSLQLKYRKIIELIVTGLPLSATCAETAQGASSSDSVTDRH